MSQPKELNEEFVVKTLEDFFSPDAMRARWEEAENQVYGETHNWCVTPVQTKCNCAVTYSETKRCDEIRFFVVWDLVATVKKHLTDDLKNPKYRGQDLYAGFCYVASEAIYHLLPEGHPFKPCYVRINGDTHWFLRDKATGNVIDVTAEQYKDKVDYDQGTHCGFLTKQPSKRAQVLIDRVVPRTQP